MSKLTGFTIENADMPPVYTDDEDLNHDIHELLQDIDTMLFEHTPKNWRYEYILCHTRYILYRILEEQKGEEK